MSRNLPVYVLVLATVLNVVTLSTLEAKSCHGPLNCAILGFSIEAASSFKCSLDNVKRSFYRSFNSIFGRVGRVASNEVIRQLLKSKCLPVLYYGMEACPLRKVTIQVLGFCYQ